jgi:hypothetical protein
MKIKLFKPHLHANHIDYYYEKLSIVIMNEVLY